MQRYDFASIVDDNLIMRAFPDLLKSCRGIQCYDLSKTTRRDNRKKRPRKRPALRFREFDSAFFVAMENKPFLFSCPICRNILKGPITVDCGHTFCSSCLDLTNNRQCVVCYAEIGDKRFVNVLIQDLVEKWREKNKYNASLNSMVSNSYDVMGVEPRYHLRSGYAGLNFKRETRDNMRDFITKAIGNGKVKRQKWKKGIKSIKSTNVNLDQESLFMFLNNVLSKLAHFKDQALRDSWRCITTSDLECVLCSRCFLDPVATGCGHTFCRGCLTRVLDYGLACPLCKSQLTVSDYARGPIFALHRAIHFLVPKEYNERMCISLQEGIIIGNNSDIPVFICTTAFPGVACPLYVYEPRYRLMARRCLQSPTKLFAMAAKENNGQKFSSFGTMLEIKDAVTLEDGRFILTTVGIRRFKVISSDEKDGYDTAKVEYIKDNNVPTEKMPELMALHQKVHNKAIKWIRSFKRKVLSEVERLIGQMPDIECNWTDLPDGPSWTWWLMPLLPLSSKLQVGFLSTTSLDKRLRAIDKMLEHMKVRMKALERGTESCAESEDSSSESCQYVMPFHSE